MKQPLLLFSLLFSPLFLFAQNADEPNAVQEREPTLLEDKTGIERRPVLSQRAVSIGMLTFDIGFSSWMQDYSFNLSDASSDFALQQGRSFHLDFGLFPTRINLAKHKLNLLTSFNFDIQQHAFQEPIILQEDSDPLNYTLNPDQSYRKNKLAATYIKLPLMLNYTADPTRPLRSFRVSAGGYGELLMRARQKTKLPDRAADKNYDDFNLDRLQYGVTARIGFSFLEVYANYALNDFFQKDKGPNLRTLQFGFRLLTL